MLSQVKLIAEPWDVGLGGYQVGNFPAPWREWNGKFRDTIRRYWKGDDNLAGEVGHRLAGSADLYQGERRRPQASINFITAHDGFTLHDLVTYGSKHNDANGEWNKDGADDNQAWNHGVEGETDDAGHHRTCASGKSATCWPPCSCRRACRCWWRATRWAAPRAATTTPIARTTRCPGSTGIWTNGARSCWNSPAA